MAKAMTPIAGPYVTGTVLRRVATSMVPFYRKIAGNSSYARQWSTAVVTADLDLMGRLLSSIPALDGVDNYATNGIGYFISFPYPAPVASYTNGTTIPPGTVQFTFNPQVHRRIASALLPLYRKLAASRRFAERFAAAIRRNDSRTLQIMIRRYVTARSLRSVTIQEQGVALLFKTSLSKYPYRNLLFQEIM